ncbi:MAG TPA: hypothetical protein VID50_02565 [Candidatus Eisenbacteria bacterium]|jgi:hypothetical protein
MMHELVRESRCGGRAGGTRGRRQRRARAARLAAVLLLALAAGCGRRAGPPAVVMGTPCATCGMSVSDRHFACVRQVDGRWRTYDSIECLIRDAASTPGGIAYLSDYDTATLHPADSLWIVQGEFSSPMGGGLASFLHRGAADTVASRTSGRVARFTAIGRERAP